MIHLEYDEEGKIRTIFGSAKVKDIKEKGLFHACEENVQ